MSEQLPFLDFYVAPHDDYTDLPLARALKERLPNLSWGQVRELCTTGKVKVDGDKVLDGRRKVPAGARVTLEPNAPAKPDPVPKADPGLRIYLEDSQVLVFEKPAGVATVPYEDQERVTVLDLVRRNWRKGGKTDPSSALFVVQRLDKETSGVMVLARTDQARSLLEHQLRGHSMGREYLAVVHGVMARDEMHIETYLAPDRGDGLRGSVEQRSLGKEAITHVEVIERMEQATLVRCTLETGRTHQIRIHLSEAGYPLLGERVYIREYKGTLLPAPRVALHATRLSFRHPVMGKSIKFYSSLPADLVALVRSLGGTLEPLKSRVEAVREARLAKSQQKTFEHSVRDWWTEGAPKSQRSPHREAGEERRPPRGPRTSGEEGARPVRPARREDGWEGSNRPDRQSTPLVADRERRDGAGERRDGAGERRDGAGERRPESRFDHRTGERRPETPGGESRFDHRTGERRPETRSGEGRFERPRRPRFGADDSAGVRQTRSPSYNPRGARRLARPAQDDPEAARRERQKQLDSLAKSRESLMKEALQPARRDDSDGSNED